MRMNVSALQRRTSLSVKSARASITKGAITATATQTPMRLMMGSTIVSISQLLPKEISIEIVLRTHAHCSACNLQLKLSHHDDIYSLSDALGMGSTYVGPNQ